MSRVGHAPESALSTASAALSSVLQNKGVDAQGDGWVAVSDAPAHRDDIEARGYELLNVRMAERLQSHLRQSLVSG